MILSCVKMVISISLLLSIKRTGKNLSFLLVHNSNKPSQ